MRWDEYVLARGLDVEATWAEASAGKKSLYVLGEGFDPRTLAGVRRVAASNAIENLHVLSLALGPEGSTSERAAVSEANVIEVSELAKEHGFSHERLPYPEIHERTSLGRVLFQALVTDSDLAGYGHVIIDVSALPTGVYFGFIGGFLDLVDTGDFDGELQVVIAENSEIDRRIVGEGSGTPAPIVGFRFDTELEQSADRPPLVWAPVLGEGARPQLEALEQQLGPDEICPVLPFPAHNPRRADDILLSKRDLMTDQFQIEPTNYIYAQERNPFDLYRTLSHLRERYRRFLAPLGDAEIVISTHSSKTLSIGVLLAAHEHHLTVMNAEPEHYRFDDSDLSADLLKLTEISSLWLVGVPSA